MLVMAYADVCPIYKCGDIKQVTKEFTICANYKDLTKPVDVMIDT